MYFRGGFYSETSSDLGYNWEWKKQKWFFSQKFMTICEWTVMPKWSWTFSYLHLRIELDAFGFDPQIFQKIS